RPPDAEALAPPDSAYVHRSMYATQLEPFVARFGDDQVEVVSREELKGDREGTMRRAFRFAGVDDTFFSPQFSREWETGGGKRSGRFRLMDRAVRAPGLRGLDRRFDRLPESLRWLVERVVHNPEGGEAERTKLPAARR